MNVEELTTQVKALQEQVKTFQNELSRLQDIDEIKTLQRAYGYYLEHWMFQEIIDCFADSPDAAFDSFPGSTWAKRESLDISDISRNHILNFYIN